MKKYNIILIIINVTLASFAQEPWPLAPQGTQCVIGGSIGEFRTYNTRFHAGTDISGPINTPVLCIREGIVNNFNNLNTPNTEVIVANIRYIYVKPKIGLVQNDQVHVRDVIGYIHNNHVHLQQDDRNFLLTVPVKLVLRQIR